MSVWGRIKNEIKDILVLRKARNDAPKTETYETVLRAISDLSTQEKESLYFELRKRLDGSNETTVYGEKIYRIYSQQYLEESEDLTGIRILELGPGINLAAGIHFVLAGAAQYVAVDALAAFPERPRDFYASVLEELRTRPGIVGRISISQQELQEIVSLEPEVRFNPERIAYHTPVYAEHMPFSPDHFDYIYSNASFEHFEQPEKVIRELFRVLKPGGLTVHTIDLRDHNDFDQPREFLKVPVNQYRFTSPYGTNRWRSVDFKTAFESAGFSLHKFEINEQKEISDAEYETLDAYFKQTYSRSELEILGIDVAAVKPLR